ncbi:MAG: TIGR03905 family TSCPD domain-containing protein [Lachnospiraceae bacterium]|nr:TIGR03905 family TSCPD domain-containing protein [Lachnospiraceae bacterium]
MTHYTYHPKGVCSMQIDYDLDEEGKIHNLAYVGGCNGNLKAIGRLLEGTDAKKAADILRGNDCKGRGTSCADQLARSIDQIFTDTRASQNA